MLKLGCVKVNTRPQKILAICFLALLHALYQTRFFLVRFSFLVRGQGRERFAPGAIGIFQRNKVFTTRLALATVLAFGSLRCFYRLMVIDCNTFHHPTLDVTIFLCDSSSKLNKFFKVSLVY